MKVNIYRVKNKHLTLIDRKVVKNDEKLHKLYVKLIKKVIKEHKNTLYLKTLKQDNKHIIMANKYYGYVIEVQDNEII